MSYSTKFCRSGETTVAVVMAVDEDPQTLLQRLNLALARAKQPLALSA